MNKEGQFRKWRNLGQTPQQLLENLAARHGWTEDDMKQIGLILEYAVSRAEKGQAEALELVERLAAAGARLTALAGGVEVENGDMQFVSKEGMFSEHIAHQNIRGLFRRIKELESRLSAAKVSVPPD